MADENAAPMAALQTPISLPPPPRFHFENPGEWPQRILQFEDYSFASGLYRAIDEARIHEDAIKARADAFKGTGQYSTGNSAALSEAKLGQRRQFQPRASQKGAKSKSSEKCYATLQTKPSCRYCGRPTHPRLECPAHQAKCYNCNGKGHFGNVWEKKRNVNTVELHPVSSTKNTDLAKFVRVVLNGHDGLFKVDTGAAVTVVSKEFPGVPKKLPKPDQVLTGPGNTRLDVLGVFQATLEWKEKATVQPVYVLPHQQPPLLAFPAITAVGIAKFVDPVSVEKPAFLTGDIFEGLG
ncbi:hypothetical protein MTO96_033878 [Rhipicephalus appendiculatus]